MSVALCAFGQSIANIQFRAKESGHFRSVTGGGEVKPVHINLLGLAGIVLLISGCTTGGNRQPVVAGHASVSCSSCGEPGSCDGSGYCRPPMWYWSHGRYIPLIDDFLTKRAARKCAIHSLAKMEAKQCANNNDFRQGYIQAYEDLALGSRGLIPAVAPPKYWKAHNRSIKGHMRADQWFAGYRAALSQSGYRIADEQVTVPTSHEAFQNPDARYGYNHTSSQVSNCECSPDGNHGQY